MKTWDTNFLLRHLLEDDPAQLAIVRRELAHVEDAGATVFLPQIVLVETAWYLRGLLSRVAVLDTLQEVLDDRRFACERPDEVKSAIRDARRKGDFSDHLIAASARAAAATPVQTFDKALRGFAAFEIAMPG
ncbi:MAG TPA: PIN domain-containing protein [Luteolibacter sp.]|nr:PIN domain-containing protein [Luteolibacter sp.]